MLSLGGGGYGSKFEGLHSDELLRKLRGLSFVGASYTGDSIGTNHAVYKHVRRSLVSERGRSSGIKVCIFVRCSIHQYSLVRRAVVDKFDAYWSNLVRLAHLFESSAFKKRFRAALNHVLLEKFDFVKLVGPMPENARRWQEVRANFLREFAAGVHPAKIAALLMIDNGDMTSDRFVHICLGCCDSKMAAFEKMYAVLLAVLIRGYPVPLLYRWKHYEPAKGYLARGLGLHNVLRQVMDCMKSGKSAYIEDLLGKGATGETHAQENAERQNKAGGAAVNPGILWNTSRKYR